MKLDGQSLLAYAGYLLWLCAGLFDFLCHRRTDLPRTSGVAESSLHLVQLALIGAAVVFGLLFETGRTVAAVLLALVAAHAVVGYMDTRVAFRRRTLLPVEQHLHSVLDMAPIIALAWLVAATWPAAVSGGWDLAVREPALDLSLWVAVLLPALMLCCWPAVLEFRAAWARRTEVRHGG